MGWRDLERAAPQLAAVARERVLGKRVALLGTIRSDGSPRISPVEPYLCDGRLLFGAMGWSWKAADLVRDPRFTLHSTVTSPDGGEPEIKLYGRANEADPALRAICRDAWWVGRPESSARVFEAEVTQATLVVWDLAAGELSVRTWSMATGEGVRRRRYP
jgi:hypothetical protein